MKRAIRCAIYTRKSTEEGLEQDFNSLAAQREACEAYVKSQVGEGWRALSSAYDDGGFSGGNTERPALKQLLADVDDGLVDVVVVYKVDRLTRSLADFARIVERFEARSVSFVSVTQSFNTTSSMGRLTLNVLLSFAQFEREVTGERIRDKIAASKKRGLWMGGYPPLGYTPDGRTLKIEPDEAEIVRAIFARYLELGSVTTLARDLARKDVRSKVWTTRAGRTLGGGVLRTGQLRYLLKNRTYLGEIPHRDTYWPGLHTPIVDAEVFARVQEQLAKKATHRRERAAARAPLAGLIVDDADGSLISTFTKKQSGGRYRYYTSALGVRPAKRIPAPLIEAAVLGVSRRVFDARDWRSAAIKLLGVTIAQGTLRTRWRADERDLDAIRARLGGTETVQIEQDGVTIETPFRPRRWKGEVRLFDQAGSPSRSTQPDETLVGLMTKARAWRRALIEDRETLPDLVAREGVTVTYVVRVLRAAYLAPEITRAVLAGHAPLLLSSDTIIKGAFPLEWAAQRRKFGVDLSR